MTDEYKPSAYYVQNSGDDRQGLYYQPPPQRQAKEAELVLPPPIWICGLLDVVARSRDGDSNNHGLLLEWYDPDQIKHEWVMPFELITGDGVEVRKTLMNGGLRISTKKNAKDHLLTWLSEVEPEAVVRSVFAIGWQDGGVYVLHNQVFGE